MEIPSTSLKSWLAILQVHIHSGSLSGLKAGERIVKGNGNGQQVLDLMHTSLSTLTESGSRCGSRKAENSTRRSLVVPMERPCQAGTEGAGADAGSNPERPIVTFNAGHSPPLGQQANTGAGPYKQMTQEERPATPVSCEVGVRFWPRTLRQCPDKACGSP